MSTFMRRAWFVAGLCSAVVHVAAARADEPPAHVHGGDDASDAGAKAPEHEKHPLDPRAPKPTGKALDLRVGAETAKPYVARPKGKVQGAILVLHEYWGLNDWVKHQADLLAKDGYLALAVDLYKGKVTADPKEAVELMKNKDDKWDADVEAAGIAWLKTNAKGAKLATVGWCMGGGESLNASLANAKDVSATVIYYGLPVTDVEKLKTLQGPILGFYANQDGWITKDKVAAFDKALTEAGVKHDFHAYDADHAFANPSSGRYQPEAAKDAWKKTEAFLARSLR
jgi:carboxymethylenebutenolidase